jgi:predicted GNAT family acetyltransferase
MKSQQALLPEFIAYHRTALQQNEARHNLMLGLLARAERDGMQNLRVWTFGEPGAGAIQVAGWPIVLGELQRNDCETLAERTRDLDYAGVVGPEHTARWFADRASALGILFQDPIPQAILALTANPVWPNVSGAARRITVDDARLFAKWILAFIREAVPHDPVPSAQEIEKMLGQDRHMFWVVDGEPVAMAGIARRTHNAGAISSVYTPMPLRQLGYAGAITATLVQRIFAEGRSIACLYTDLRNPYSNRCYAKIGFKPVCQSWVCLKASPAAS